ncbi:hypothetical protein Lal_00008676 [Lupinus albus]|nr:hypothetical protein Lal_00008676 [Lupinus albus]
MVVLSPVTVSSVHDWKSVDSGSRFKAMKTPTHGGVEKPKVIFFPLIGSKRSRWSHDDFVLIRILKKSLAISPYAMKLSSSNAPPTTFWNHIFRHH